MTDTERNILKTKLSEFISLGGCGSESDCKKFSSCSECQRTSLFTIVDEVCEIDGSQKVVVSKEGDENITLTSWSCPVCNGDLYYMREEKKPYCPDCGVKLDWE